MGVLLDAMYMQYEPDRQRKIALLKSWDFTQNKEGMPLDDMTYHEICKMVDKERLLQVIDDE